MHGEQAGFCVSPIRVASELFRLYESQDTGQDEEGGLAKQQGNW
jgi:hypothetical protein